MKTFFNPIKNMPPYSTVAMGFALFFISQWATAQVNLYQARTSAVAANGYAIGWKKSPSPQAQKITAKGKSSKRPLAPMSANDEAQSTLALPMAPGSVLAQEREFSWVAPHYLDQLVEAVPYELPESVAPMQVLSPGASFKWVGVEQDTKTSGVFVHSFH